MKKTDDFYLNLALKQAKKAKQLGRVPIGAVIVQNGEVVVQTYNQKDDLRDATAHAEMLAIRRAGKKIGPNLDDCVMYVTLKPCLMCLSAAYWAHVKRVVYGLDRQPGLEKYFVTTRDLSDKMMGDLVLRKMKIEKGVMPADYRDVIQ